MNLVDISERLNRSLNAVYARANTIGLHLACPESWEYLTHAAERTGYHVSQLRRILAVAGIELQHALSRARNHRQGTRAFIVAPELVNQAISAWLEAEPVAVAARRLGTTALTLERRLAAIGLRRTTTGRCHWRVRSSDIERAVTAWPLPRRAA
jgi:hypothetical protein